MFFDRANRLERARDRAEMRLHRKIFFGPTGRLLDDLAARLPAALVTAGAATATTDVIVSGRGLDDRGPTLVLWDPRRRLLMLIHHHIVEIEEALGESIAVHMFGADAPDYALIFTDHAPER